MVYQLSSDWVIANGMRPGIINLSLGAPGRSDAMKRAVETATRVRTTTNTLQFNDFDNFHDIYRVDFW